MPVHRNFAACRSGSRLLGLRGSRLPGTSVTAGLTVRRLGHGLEDLVDDLIGADSLGVGIEVGEDAMAEHGPQDGADVAGADGQPAVEDGAGLGGQNEVLGGPRSGAQASQSLMKPSAPGSLGRVARTRSTA